jgi:hypothetical protein
MTDVLIPVAQREFEIRQWKSDIALQFNRALLTRRELERIARDGYSILHVRVSVYSLRES